MSDKINELDKKIHELEAFNSRIIIGAMNAMDGITTFKRTCLLLKRFLKSMKLQRID